MTQKMGRKIPGHLYSSGILSRIRKIYKDKGARFLLRKICVFAWRYFYANSFMHFHRQRCFAYENNEYIWFFHPYNFTWDNERAVEIPIALREINSAGDQKILEVGNVLSHYVPVRWDVLDKFEKGGDIIAGDVVDFKPSEKYDLIISISTLEHVGFDDDIRDTGKIAEAVINLKRNCLKPGGRMLFTMPLGYNNGMDNLLFENKLGFDELHFMKRTSRNSWREVSQDQLGDTSYAATYIEASAIVIAEFTDSRTK